MIRVVCVVPFLELKVAVLGPKIADFFFAGLRPAPRWGSRPRPRLGLPPQTPLASGGWRLRPTTPFIYLFTSALDSLTVARAEEEEYSREEKTCILLITSRK